MFTKVTKMSHRDILAQEKSSLESLHLWEKGSADPFGAWQGCFCFWVHMNMYCIFILYHIIAFHDSLLGETCTCWSRHIKTVKFSYFPSWSHECITCQHFMQIWYGKYGVYITKLILYMYVCATPLTPFQSKPRWPHPGVVHRSPQVPQMGGGRCLHCGLHCCRGHLERIVCVAWPLTCLDDVSQCVLLGQNVITMA